MFGIVVLNCIALAFAAAAVISLLYECFIRPTEKLAEEQYKLEQRLKDIEEKISDTDIDRR